MPTSIAIPARLEDLPNIGRSLAKDLCAIGIASPGELRKKSPLKVFGDLKPQMGRRHDPCVLYTLLAVKHFFETDESLPWWKFTQAGKALLAKQSDRKSL